MKRVSELDSLRGLAAIGVVLFHAFPHSAASIGWIGVDLFFVLSGFLITRVILDSGHQPGFLRDFYLRRVARIWPVYYLTLGAVLIANGLSPIGYRTDGLVPRLFFLQHLPHYWGGKSPEFPPSFGPSWTVAIEEQFYAVWPLVVLFLGTRTIPLLAAALLSVCVAFRAFAPEAAHILLSQGDGLAFGCGLALAMRVGARKIHAVLLTLTALGGAYAAVYTAAFWRDPGVHWLTSRHLMFSAFFCGLIGLVVLHAGHASLKPLRVPLLCWFGSISYGLYMFHLPIMTYAPPLLERLGLGSPALRGVVTWASIVVLPALSWYGVERPLLRYQASLAKTRAVQPQVASQ
jgi:peptidoglycan/LPS O-acetylase OafA/YrhL